MVVVVDCQSDYLHGLTRDHYPGSPNPRHRVFHTPVRVLGAGSSPSDQPSRLSHCSFGLTKTGHAAQWDVAAMFFYKSEHFLNGLC